MKRKVLVTAALVTTALVGVAGTAMADDRGMGMGSRGHGDRPFLGGIIMLVLIAGLAILGTWLVLRRKPVAVVAAPMTAPIAGPAAAPTANAESILADRLARSEISPEDYRATLAALRESAEGSAS